MYNVWFCFSFKYLCSFLNLYWLFCILFLTRGLQSFIRPGPSKPGFDLEEPEFQIILVLLRSCYLSLRLLFRIVASLFSHFLLKRSDLRCLLITSFRPKRFPCLSRVWAWGCCSPGSQSKPMTQSVRKGRSASWEVFNTKTCWAFE